MPLELRQSRMWKVCGLSMPGLLRSCALPELLRYFDVARLSGRESLPEWRSEGERSIEIGVAVPFKRPLE
jgi:hypothetical protein